MKHQKKIVVGISVVTLFLVLAIGVTYSLWSKTFAQSGENRLVSDCFHIVFEEVENSGITLEDTFPILDSDGKKLKPYEFSITNTCNVPVEYQVNFETTNNTTMYDQYVKFMFQENEPILLTELENTEVTLKNGKSAYKLEKGYLIANESKNYKVRIWMDENVTQNSEEAMNSIFEGKIAIHVSYLSNYDSNKPVGKVIATREGNIVTIDASNSFDADSSIKKYYYSVDGENYIMSFDDIYQFEEKVSYGKGIDTIMNLYDARVKNVYVKVEDELGNMSDVVSLSLQELFYDETVDNNLRYVGTNPYNYVLFNNELWRIIGVMNNINDGSGKKESRIKLVRDESIGEYTWGISSRTENDGLGINEWSIAALNTLLNDYYYNQKSNQTCYVGNNGNILTKTCDFRSIGLSSTARTFLDNAVWNLGNGGSTLVHELKVPQFYDRERSNLVKNSCDPTVNGGKYCTDKVNRTTTWVGKIGLVYPSDYGFSVNAFDPSVRKDCLDVPPSRWNEVEDKKCGANNWFKDKETQWTLTPAPMANHFALIMFVRGNFGIAGDYATYAHHVYPTLYLKNDVNIVAGNGSKESPFELSLG